MINQQVKWLTVNNFRGERCDCFNSVEIRTKQILSVCSMLLLR